MTLLPGTRWATRFFRKVMANSVFYAALLGQNPVSLKARLGAILVVSAHWYVNATAVTAILRLVDANTTTVAVLATRARI